VLGSHNAIREGTPSENIGPKIRMLDVGVPESILIFT